MVEVRLHLGLVLEGRAVDALELRILFVAEVVGARDVGELERADVAGAHDVRPGAEIDEIAVGVERDFLALGNAVEDIELELARRRRGPTAPPAGPTRPSLIASSRETAERTKGWLALVTAFISASIRSKSAGEIRCGRSTS